MSERQSLVDLGLANKGALVIGTGPGMGQATVAALAGAGAQVACFDIDEAATIAAAAIVESSGGNALSITGDATKREDVVRAVADTRRAFGSIDVVVGVVGLGTAGGRLLDIDDEGWDTTLDICLKSAVYTIQAAVAPMLEQGRGGSIVFISSIGGISGLPGQAPYAAAKAGLINLVKTLALEYGMENIRFNTVAPGIIHTPQIDTISSPEDRAAQDRLVPLRRMGRPEDVAKAVLFVVSDLGSYVSGQTLAVDGAVSAKYQMPAFWADWDRD